MQLGILKSYGEDHIDYVSSCENLGIAYKIIDLLSPDWILQINNSGCNGFLCHPPCDISEKKHIYDERIYFINKVLGHPVYPSFDEQFIYENKRNMAYWLQSMSFPHPKTNVFLLKREAIEYINKANFPLVFKTSTGAASSGVSIVKTHSHAKRIINQVFGYFHPLIAFGKIRYIKSKKGLPIPIIGDLQKHYVIIQEFHQLKHEWRIVKIGKSYFGHQKLLNGNFASGSLKKNWETPPEKLLHLVKAICEKGNFYSMSVDIFETKNNEYLINELQCIFGQSTPYLMLRNGLPGRFYFDRDKNTFQFEEGDFNKFNSKLLRVEHFINILKGKR